MGPIDTAQNSSRLRWLPNALTVGRLLALPVLWRVISRSSGPSPRAAWLFAGVGITDLLDGMLARRLDAQTRFGRLADPLADRLLLLVGLLGLVRMRRFSPLGPLALLLRDAVSLAGFAALSRRGVTMRVDGAGKASSALAMATTALALGWRKRWIDRLFVGAVVACLGTLVHYAVRAGRSRPGGGLPGPIRSDSQRELEGEGTAPFRDQEH